MMRIVDVDAFVKPREEWLKKELRKNYNEDFLRGYLEGVEIILSELMFAPTVDAELARHGHWEMTKDGAALCSSCKRKMNPCQYGYPRCAMCGAIMGEKVDDNE